MQKHKLVNAQHVNISNTDFNRPITTTADDFRPLIGRSSVSSTGILRHMRGISRLLAIGWLLPEAGGLSARRLTHALSGAGRSSVINLGTYVKRTWWLKIKYPNRQYAISLQPVVRF